MPFTPDDLDRIVAETSIERIEYRDQVDSTSTWAMNDARAGAVGPCLYLTDHQTAGRGRGGAAWWSGEGGLAFTLLTGEVPIAGAQIPRLSLGVGVALCEALEPMAGQPVQLKWPNDIMVRGRKLAGVLIEVPGGGPPRLAIGIGINVANRLEEGPEGLRGRAISLAEARGQGPGVGGQGSGAEGTERVCVLFPEVFPEGGRSEVGGRGSEDVAGLAAGRGADRVCVLIRAVNALGGLLGRLGESGSELADRWRQHAFLDGRQVEIELPGGRRLEGLAQSIDDEGALLMATDEGVERCSTGTVVRWGEVGGQRSEVGGCGDGPWCR